MTQPDTNPQTIRAFKANRAHYLNQAQTRDITIHKRHKPYAVIMNIDRYNELLELEKYKRAVENFTDRYDVRVDTQEFLRQNTT